MNSVHSIENLRGITILTVLSPALSPRFEELPKKFQTFRRPHAFRNLQLVIQKVGIGDPELASNTAKPQIPGTEHQTSNPRVHQRSGAHWTRLQSDIKR